MQQSKHDPRMSLFRFSDDIFENATNSETTDKIPFHAVKIQRFENELEGWKCKLIPRGGRMQLVNSVLSSIPIYFMACFRLSKWVIKRLDKIRRGFLWGKIEDNKTALSLID